MSAPGRPPTRSWRTWGAGSDPKAWAKRPAQLLMMIDQDGPEPCEKEQARRRGITLGPQQRDGTRSIRGRLDAEAGAYWEAILAKEAAPGANNPDDDAPGADNPDDEPRADGEPTAERARPIAGPRPSAITTHSKRSAVPPCVRGC